MKDDAYTMSEAARNAQREYKREYMRKWRAANKDKVSANNCSYWERRAQRGKEQIIKKDE